MRKAVYAFTVFTVCMVLFTVLYKVTFEMDGREAEQKTWRQAAYQSVMTQTAMGLAVPKEETYTMTANMLHCIIAYSITVGILASLF